MLPLRRIRFLAPALGVLAMLLLSPGAWAQGDGPRTNYLTPVDLFSLSLSYVTVESNFRFGQSAVLDDAELESRSGVLALSWRFEAGGRFNQVNLVGSVTTLDGRATLPPRPGELQRERLGFQRTGPGDPGVSWRLGLLGAPALTPAEYADYQPAFQLYSQIGFNVPLGDYDPRVRFNPGTNRWSLHAKLPMVIPMPGRQRTTFLEVVPSVSGFGTNDEPFGDISQLEQESLWAVEAHIVHNLSPRWWLSAGIQYQNGGRTVADGVPDDNRLDQWLGEVSFGFIPNRRVAFLGSYGRIFELENETRGEMFRLRLVVFL